MKRQVIYLASAFISFLGDFLMVSAIPVGLGVEADDLRATALLYLIPGFAMLISTSFAKNIFKRHKTSRKDYAALLIVLGFVELFVAYLAYHTDSLTVTISLIAVFIFTYAFIKEGLPRIFYSISVHSYFVEDSRYSKITGYIQALKIAAFLLGSVLAAYLIYLSNWRLALLIDAVTFVLFGLVILYFGTDQYVNKTKSQKPAAKMNWPGSAEFFEKRFACIAILLPLMMGASLVVWPYLPILSKEYNITTVEFSIIAIALFNLPGMIGGFKFNTLYKSIPSYFFIKILPLGYIATCLLFVCVPSTVTFILLTVIRGVVEGLYWPADSTIRNSLVPGKMILFNQDVLKGMSWFQISSCLLVMLGVTLASYRSIAIIVITVTLAIGLWYSVKVQGQFMIKLSQLQRIRIATLLQVVIGTLLVFGLSYYHFADDSRKKLNFLLPSITLDHTIDQNLSYSAFMVLNETSAKLVKLGANFEIQPVVAQTIVKSNNEQQFTINIDPNYRTWRNEIITAEDLAFTIFQYLTKYPMLSGPLAQIDKAGSCTKDGCQNLGVRVIDSNALQLTLNQPNQKFIEELANAWIYILKRNRPLYEIVGSCKLPYQTGRSHVTKCSDKTIGVLFPDDRELLLTADELAWSTRKQKSWPSGKLVVDNPGLPNSPTLTIMNVYANPNSSLDSNLRTEVLKRLRKASTTIASNLMLKPAYFLTPNWLGPSKAWPKAITADIKTPNTSCPATNIRFLIDNSLPYLDVLKRHLTQSVGCPSTVRISSAESFFDEFAKNDFGVAWYTPDHLAFYHIFAVFDCSSNGMCYFNWHDSKLQSFLDKLKIDSFNNISNSELAFKIEQHLASNGYVAPIAELNWWIKKGDSYHPIHPAGLAQVSAGDFW